MKTSRNDGILAITTKYPYKVAIEGQLEERTEIICHDVNSKCENAAADLEQLVIRALTAIPAGQANVSKAQMAKDEKKDSDFYQNESPSDKEVSDQAMNLSLVVQMNQEVNISDIVKVFDEILAGKVVCYNGDLPMTQTVWASVNRKDKLDIMFKYIAFFVNPLEQLSAMASSMESRG